MKISAKYRKFRKELLSKGIEERYIFNYYEEACNQGLWDPYSVEELIEDFGIYYETTKEMEREDNDWSDLVNDIMETRLKGTKIG